MSKLGTFGIFARAPITLGRSEQQALPRGGICTYPAYSTCVAHADGIFSGSQAFAPLSFAKLEEKE